MISDTIYVGQILTFVFLMSSNSFKNEFGKAGVKKLSPFLNKKAITDCAASVVQDIRKAAGGLLLKTLND